MFHRAIRERLRLLAPDGGGEGGNAPAATVAATPADADAGDADPPNVDGLKSALAKERAGRREMEKQVRDLAAKQAERDAADKRAADEKAKADGEWERLAAERDAENATLKAQLATRDRDALRAKVAAKHKLPADLASRLTGDSEDDLDKDAAKLAKLVLLPKAPNTEAGAGNTETRPPKPAADTGGRSYAFVSPNDQQWPA